MPVRVREDRRADPPRLVDRAVDELDAPIAKLRANGVGVVDPDRQEAGRRAAGLRGCDPTFGGIPAEQVDEGHSASRDGLWAEL